MIFSIFYYICLYAILSVILGADMLARFYNKKSFFYMGGDLRVDENVILSGWLLMSFVWPILWLYFIIYKILRISEILNYICGIVSNTLRRAIMHYIESRIK